MKYYLLVVVLLIAFGACINKKKDLDIESMKVDSFMSFYQDSIYTNPVRTMVLIRDIQRLVKDSFNYYRLHSMYGMGCYATGSFDSAVITDKSVIRFCQSVAHPESVVLELEAVAFNNIGSYFYNTGQRDSAVNYMQKAVQSVIRSGNLRNLPLTYTNIADLHTHKGDLPTAADLYRKALFIADSLQLDNQLIPIYCGLGLVYMHLKNFKEADGYFKKLEAFFDTVPAIDQYFIGNARCNYYHSAQEYEKCLYWIKKANHAAVQLAEPSYSAITEANLGEVYLLLNHPDSAKYYLDKAAVFFLADDAPENFKYNLNGLYAAYYLQKNDLRKADEYLSVSYDLTQVNPYYIHFNDIRQEELYKKRGDYRKAYELTKKAQLYDDSARNATRQNQIAEIDFRYRQDTILMKRNFELTSKEQKIVQLKKTNILVFSLLGVFVLLVAAIAIYRRKQRELQRARQMATITQLRMESIRNRISPHFMFNVLNSVIPNLREYADLTRPMQLLIESIRGNLLVSEKIALTLEEEIGIVKNYLALLESINHDNPQVVWSVEPDVDLDTLVPSMIIQIPVENAIKYAFEGRKSDKLLEINISCLNKFLVIEVLDNGIGFDPGRSARRTDKGTGTGLHILYKTIEMLNVMNQEKMEFDINNEVNISADKHGTKVLIKIPLDYKYEV